MIAFLLHIQSAGKAAREEKSQATTDQSKSKPVRPWLAFLLSNWRVSTSCVLPQDVIRACS
jgi:hypothetical protein